MRKLWILSMLALGLAGACRPECETDTDCKGTRICDVMLRACVDPPAICPAGFPFDCGDTIPGICCPSEAPYCCSRDGQCHDSAASCNAPACSSAGRACASTASCCTGLTCQAGTCKSPSCAGQTCITSANCCAGFTCSRFGRKCQAAQSLVIGDACTANAQCSSGLCSDYCTKPCTRTSDCGAANYCLETISGFLCIPFCRNNADCAVYGARTACQTGPDPNGSMLPGCYGL